jgi:glycosyltransferase involved in cell wall biosynthesis
MKSMTEIFISDQIGADKISAPNSIGFGRANYSWKIISNLYQRGLERAGFETRKLARPETYQTEIARRCVGARSDSIHLAVKPIEELRPLLGAKNLYVCGWEFPEISREDFGLNPFFNQHRVLSRANRLLCWSDYTASNLRRAGLKNAITLPPPVTDEHQFEPEVELLCPSLQLNTNASPGSEVLRPLAQVVRENKGKRRLVTVLNPFDLRKNLPALLRGFASAEKHQQDAILIVKLIIDNTGTHLQNINELLRVHHRLNLQSENIHFIGQELTDAEMRSLLALGDFYLCTSSTEGLNLPLVSALNVGVPAISTRNSAMSMYLSNECSVEIASKPRALEGKGHVLAEHMQVTHFVADEGDVASAIRQALQIPATRIAAMKDAAILTANRHFGQSTFERRLSDLLQSLN